MSCRHQWRTHHDRQADERHDWCARCGVTIRFYSVWTPEGDLKLRGDISPDYLADDAVVERAELGVLSVAAAIEALPRLHPERRRGRRRLVRA